MTHETSLYLGDDDKPTALTVEWAPIPGERPSCVSPGNAEGVEIEDVLDAAGKSVWGRLTPEDCEAIEEEVMRRGR